MKKEDVNVKSEGHLKITDVTDKKNPKIVISKRLFNKKVNKKVDINTVEDKPKQVEK